MPEVVVMVGLHGCGKSTWVKQNLAGSHMVLSRQLWPDAGHPGQRQRLAIADALADGLDVVVDDPNLSAIERAVIIDTAHRHGARVVAVHVDTPPTECLVRAAGRSRRSPAGPGAHRRLIPPSPDEGFDEIRTVSLGTGGRR